MAGLYEGAVDNRDVSTRLKIGIFLMPIIFAWFTLRNGYSKVARGLSLGWMLFNILFGINSALQGSSHSNEAAPVAEASITEASASRQSESPPTAPPSEPALKYVSEHIWSVWGSSCNGPRPKLSATYSPGRGQIIYRDGIILQDSNKSNIKYNFYENPDGSFNFHQKVYDTLLPNVMVT